MRPEPGQRGWRPESAGSDRSRLGQKGQRSSLPGVSQVRKVEARSVRIEKFVARVSQVREVEARAHRR